MKVAVVGSRRINNIDLENFLPEDVTEIVSGGAIGVDRIARKYAKENDLLLTEFLPEYEKYGKRAPIMRNNLIIDHADIVLAFWDGESHGTKYVIDKCHKIGKTVKIFIPKQNESE